MSEKIETVVEPKPNLEFFRGAKPTIRQIPSEIQTLMSLLKLTPACFTWNDEDWWQINNDKTLKYVRIKAETLGQDEDAWRIVLGMLIDHGNGTLP